jgi:hypothetical protein
MKFGKSFEGGNIPEATKSKEGEITPDFVRMIKEQTGIEQENILTALKKNMTYEQEVDLVATLIKENLKDLESEVDQMIAEDSTLSEKSTGVAQEEGESPITMEQEVTPRKEKLNNSKLIKVFASTCAAISAYAALSFGPMEKKAEAGGININMNAITDSLKRGVSSAIEDTLRGAGRGSSDAAQDLVKRSIGGGLTPEEKRMMMTEKIRLESTKAYDIYRFEMNEIREARQSERLMGQQEYRTRLEDIRMKQQDRRALLNDYRQALQRAKNSEEIKMAEEKFNAGIKALEIMEKGIQSGK